MKTRLLTITLAAVLAILGTFAVLAYVRQANARAVNGLKAETVMVAAGTIPAGTSLSTAQHENLLSTEKLPNSSLSTPAVQSVTGANEHLVVNGKVAKGQVLLTNMLTSAANVTANGSGSLPVPQGMIAVTVDMCVAAAVADYATPGTHVAVFDTVVSKDDVQQVCDAEHTAISGDEIKNSKLATTLLVLKDAEVLAVGQNPSTPSTTGSNVTVSTDPDGSSSSPVVNEELVTLAVKQADAERLILMGEVGLPYMALLGPDSSPAFSSPVPLFQPPQP